MQYLGGGGEGRALAGHTKEDNPCLIKIAGETNGGSLLHSDSTQSTCEQ